MLYIKVENAKTKIESVIKIENYNIKIENVIKVENAKSR